MTAPDTDTLAGLLAAVPKSGLTCADYTTDDLHQGWYICPGDAVGTIAKVRSDLEELAQLFTLAPELAARVIALEAQAAKDKARIERLEAALREAEETLRLVEHPAFPDPAHHQAVKALGLRIGFGALMSTASAAWRETLEADGYTSGGEYVAGPCFGTVASCLAKIRAALEDGE